MLFSETAVTATFASLLKVYPLKSVVVPKYWQLLATCSSISKIPSLSSSKSIRSPIPSPSVSAQALALSSKAKP